MNIKLNGKIRKFVIFFLSILFAYSAYCLFFYLLQRKLIFPTDFVIVPKGIAENIPDSSKYWIENEFGKTETWYLQPFNLESNKTYPIMIIAHGNADIIDRWAEVVKFLMESGIGVLLIEYPGYGRSEGTPSQQNITEVFIKSYDLIIKNPEVDKNKIILLGQSIGGGAICSLAKERNSIALILISAFTSIDVFASQYFLPKFLIKDTFDNLSVVAKYKNPILFVHGIDDNIIPISESEKLNSAAESGELILLDGGHNMVRKWLPFWKNIVIPFLSKNSIL